MKDIDVLNTAVREKRILITNDKDFGELAFRFKLPSLSGIILFRISTLSAKQIADIALAAVESRSDWSGHFAVVEDDRIRMTPLP